MCAARREPYATARRRKVYEAQARSDSEQRLSSCDAVPEGAQPGDSVHPSAEDDSDGVVDLDATSRPQTPSSHSQIPSRVIHDALTDLEHVEEALLWNMLSFTVSRRSLRFVHKPTPKIPYERQPLDSPTSPNSGHFMLDPRIEANREFVLYEGWLHATHWSLQALPPQIAPEVDEKRQVLIGQVISERQRLEDLKEMEWGTQGIGVDVRLQSSEEDDATIIDTDYLYGRNPASWNSADAPIFASSIVAAAMNLLYGVPLSTTTVLLSGLRAVTRLTLQYARGSVVLPPEDERLLRFISRDPRSVLNAFNLDPCVQSYVCCPRCFALYKDLGASRTTCTYRSTKASQPCGAKLGRSRRVDEEEITVPTRVYLHQSFKHWVARLISRPDIEPLLEKRPSAPPSESSPMRDIFDAIALQNLLGPDRKTPFLDAPDGELRLIFSLSVDSFNPYQMKEAKKKVSSTAMYMVCLNLPPHLRYLPENVYLVGVIPGPTKPSKEEINHFLALVVDELLDFWDPGVWYTRTYSMPFGRRVRAAMIPLVCDLVAARQIAGLGAHNHKFMLCSFCGLVQDEIENTDPDTFPPRDLESHRRAADAWLHAESTHERELLFKNTGIRYTELLRLPYWNPILYVVVDTMHNLYLGLLQNHIRNIWGITVAADDNEAHGRRAKNSLPRPTDAEMDQGLEALLYGSEAALKRCKKAVLYHLCADRGLRRAGTIAQLVIILQRWRTKEGLPAARPQTRIPEPAFQRRPEASSEGQREDSQPARRSTAEGNVASPSIQPSQNTPPSANRKPLPHVPSKEERLAVRKTLCSANKPSAFGKYRKAVLISLCEDLGLDSSGYMKDLAARLISWRIEGADENGTNQRLAQLRMPLCDVNPEPQDADTGTEVADAVHDQNPSDSPASAPQAKEKEERKGAIGRNTLQAFVEDRTRMELPTWVSRAPAGFGTVQHGKLSADQWRTVGVINLPITLIRTWGTELTVNENAGSDESRKAAVAADLGTLGAGHVHKSGPGTPQTGDVPAEHLEPSLQPEGDEESLRAQMLRNFLDLVDAVETVGLLETTEEEIEHAEEALERYLDGLKKLYFATKLNPNDHLALHIGMFIRLFGPVHSWRAFAFERFNYMLQSINASKILGQLEVSFMMHSCRAANLRPLLRTEPVHSMMQEFIDAHNRVSGEDRRGMRFDDAIHSRHKLEARGHAGERPKRCTLQGSALSALCNRFNTEAGFARYSSSARDRQPGQILLSATAISCTKVAIAGVLYKPHRQSPGDSNVIIAHPQHSSKHWPARIEQIVLYNRVNMEGQVMEDTILFVRCLMELDVEDREKDPYRRYPRVGGSLYYSVYDEDLLAIRPNDVVCHFAKTRMDHLSFQRRVKDAAEPRDRLEEVRFAKPCVHVRSLDRLLRSSRNFEQSEEVVTGEAEEKDLR